MNEPFPTPASVPWRARRAERAKVLARNGQRVLTPEAEYVTLAYGGDPPLFRLALDHRHRRARIADGVDQDDIMTLE